MRQLNGKTSITEIDQDSFQSGMFLEPITVKENVTLELSGMANKNIYLEKGSKVIIRGMANKDVINQGGTVEVFGIIIGSLINLHGEYIIHPKANVKKGVITQLDEFTEE